ncbi:hypothetical protein C8R47DRAFT_1290093 [Mycena vitilis]|nr:hypothetical protein C8R47DRAFT_1290093 [Mycena vitilis]
MCLVLLPTWDSLQVLVVLLYRWTYRGAVLLEECGVTDLAQDVRLVTMSSDKSLEDWVMGAYAGVDYWSRAEEFIAKRRSGEINSLQYFVDAPSLFYNFSAIRGCEFCDSRFLYPGCAHLVGAKTRVPNWKAQTPVLPILDLHPRQSRNFLDLIERLCRCLPTADACPPLKGAASAAIAGKIAQTEHAVPDIEAIAPQMLFSMEGFTLLLDEIHHTMAELEGTGTFSRVIRIQAKLDAAYQNFSLASALPVEAQQAQIRALQLHLEVKQ